eukprot:13783865-Ditylum_brightwellii.AAC.1
MESLIKKSVADHIAHILPGIISTSTSITISAITVEGNTVTTAKENTAKEISDDNTNTTATSSQDSTSESSLDPAEELDKTEDLSKSTQHQKKLNSLFKAVLIIRRKSVHNAKKGVHFDANLDDPGETNHQK